MLAETNLRNGQLYLLVLKKIHIVCLFLLGFHAFVVSSAEKNWKEKIEGGAVWIWRIHLSNDGHTKINLICPITLVIYKM